MSAATESFKRLADMHIAEDGTTGTLARALATVCDPDICVVRHVADGIGDDELIAGVLRRILSDPERYGSQDPSVILGEGQLLINGRVDISDGEQAALMRAVGSTLPIWSQSRTSSSEHR